MHNAQAQSVPCMLQAELLLTVRMCGRQRVSTKAAQLGPNWRAPLASLRAATTSLGSSLVAQLDVRLVPVWTPINETSRTQTKR